LWGKQKFELHFVQVIKPVKGNLPAEFLILTNSNKNDLSPQPFILQTRTNHYLNPTLDSATINPNNIFA
jgi:hypothetical protein